MGDLPPPGTLAVGIGIAVVERDPPQLHIGVIHQDEEGEPLLLHLAWHFRLENQATSAVRLGSALHWVKPALDEVRAYNLVAMCQLIADRADRGAVPYGILYEGGTFTDQGIMKLGAHAHGLTCATFVMHVFRSAGIELMFYGQWPSRLEDDAWHNRIVERLQRHYVDHAEKIAGEKGCARFRPEEVAGACSSTSWPAAFAFCEQRGAILREYMFAVPT